jgi:hypothetical protein
VLSSIANSSPEITAATTKQQTTKNLLQRYNARYNSPTHTSVKQHQQKQKGQRDVNSNPSLNKMQDYPNCNVQRPWSIGNGNCQNTYGYNTAECGFDGGDCEEFNAKYPNCPAPFSSWIGDGFCQNYFNHNTAECGFDGGDCDCIVPYPPKIGDGNCDGGSYNTAECEFDGGDCEEFNKYPDCTVSSPQLFGDGNCDGGNYNTAECGFDGGDCQDFNAKYPNCTVSSPQLIGDGNCDGGNYNTAECGFDEGDSCRASVWSVVGGVAGAFLFIAIGIVIWKRKRKRNTSTMQQEIAGGGGGVQGGNVRIQGNYQSIADNGAPSPSAPTQNGTMQETAAGGGVQGGNARIQGNYQSIADNGTPSPSAPIQIETREQKQHNRRFKILTSILQKVRFCQ